MSPTRTGFWFLLTLFPIFVAFLGCQPIQPMHMRSQDKAGTETGKSLIQAASFGEMDKKVSDPYENLGKRFPSISSVAAPELSKRSISLSECLALALENGRLGTFFDGAGSSQRTSVTGLTDFRTPSSVTDSIRVLAYDPAIGATAVEESLSRFDVWSKTGMFWNRTDQPNRFLFPLDVFQDLTNRNKLDNVDFTTGIFRRLPSGGFAGMSFLHNFQDNALTSSGNSQVVNPANRPRVDVTFEQPLLQGAGLLINQVRDLHPGSIRELFPDSGKPPGILLVRIGQRQQQLEFERQVHELIYRVEEAYWQLYAAYWDLYSSENGMKQAHAAWQIAKARFDAKGLGIEDLAMIEEQYHFFRNQRLQALGRGQPGRPGVLEAERRLRYVLGLPPEDGTRLIPQDAPDFLKFEPDLEQSVVDALTLRPELKQVDQEIRAAELNLVKAQDRLKPDLRFLGRYGLNGLGENVGQGIENLATNPHHDWEVGLRAEFPLGFRAGNAERTRALMQLAQRLAFLKDQREKLLFSLQRSYQEMIQNREQYKVRLQQREAAALQLKARQEKFKAGGDPKQPGSFIDLLLRAQRNWADALREEYVALCSYRISIVDFERQRGTILQFANVFIEDGQIHQEVHAHASNHIRLWHENSRKPVHHPPQDHGIFPISIDESFPMPQTISPHWDLDLPPPPPAPSNTIPAPSPRVTIGPPSATPPSSTHESDKHHE